MTGRRSFLAGLLAAGLCPAPSWADAGSPAFLTAAEMPDGSYALIGLSADGAERFALPLPARGHAAAAHPTRPEAVAFARRPGTFALVIDCRSGQVAARLDSPAGRHFMGHGTFSADGALMFTPENDYEAGHGVIGVWDVAAGYLRIDETRSGGVGPHDMARLPGGTGYVIANGGIDTHPDTGRAKLNIPTMRPNLTYTDPNGRIVEQVEIAAELHKNSIRHLALGPEGAVAFAMQWEGPSTEHPPLVGLHVRGGTPQLLQAPAELHRGLQNYAGSVAWSRASGQIAITSPRGSAAQIFDATTGAFQGQILSPDICGVAAAGTGFVATTGTGRVTRLSGATTTGTVQHHRKFDNHLVQLG